MAFGKQLGALKRDIYVENTCLHLVYALAVIVLFATLPDRFALAATMIIVLMLQVGGHNSVVGRALASDLTRKIWADMLTDRLFIEKLFEKIAERERPDVDLLFREATRAAAEDIKKGDEELDPAAALFGAGGRARTFGIVALRVLGRLIGAVLWVSFLAFIGSSLKS